jgi:hypothetical protein
MVMRWDDGLMTETPDLPSTWATRELPILRSALRHKDAGEQLVSLEVIRAEAGLDVVQMRVGMTALQSASPPYLGASRSVAGPGEVGGFVHVVTERTRRELGTWPTSANVVDELVAALERAAEREPEPDRRSRLRSLAEGLSGFAREVAVGVVSAKLNGL